MPKVKLSDNDRAEIATLYTGGIATTEITEIYDISQSYVSKLATRNGWSRSVIPERRARKRKVLEYDKNRYQEDTGQSREAYKRRHSRLRRWRGSATKFACVDCSKSAECWSQVHGTDGTDIYRDYEPRCSGCHRNYDEPFRKKRKAKPVSENKKRTLERITRAKQLSVSGMTQQQIASRFRVDRSTVSRWLSS